MSFDDTTLGESPELGHRADVMQVSVSVGAAAPAAARRASRAGWAYAAATASWSMHRSSCLSW
jgi:hypothetical protein